LESYFAIPYGDTTAKNGYWKPGPGKEFTDIVERAIPDASIIAEDLGYLTDEVRDLVEYSTYPGMKIVQYAFDEREIGDYAPYKYEENTVAYTGTHDNETTRGWSKSTSNTQIRHAMDYIGTRRRGDIPRGMIRLALQSNSNLAIIPMQDWLGLGNGARLNAPSTVGGLNWCWRLDSKAISPKLANTIAHMAHVYGRHNKVQLSTL
jgi:4-alpha-glucanotransferase